MSFESIIGNEKVKALLDKTIKSNNILHSYMFLGIDGIGKMKFAKEFAKMILCESTEKKPCNKCKACLEFENNNNPDFNVIEKYENSIKIDQIRYMNQKIVEKPIVSKRKVYIINEAETMTREAQNSLLKTLEEPPYYATIILIVSNENKLLNTIKSRCIKVNFIGLKTEEINQYIEENSIDIYENEIIEFCEGSIGKFEKLRENIETYCDVKNLLDSMKNNNLTYILNNSDVLYKNKELINDILEYLNMLLMKSKKIQMINCIQYVEETKKRLNFNSNYDMTIDRLLMKMWEEINEKYSRS